MADISMTNQSKTNVSLTNQAKGGETVTWDEAEFTWDESYPSTWDAVRTPMKRISKSNVTMTNVSKN